MPLQGYLLLRGPGISWKGQTRFSEPTFAHCRTMAGGEVLPQYAGR